MSTYFEGSSPVSGSTPSSNANVVLTNVPCDPSVIVTDAVKMVAGVAYQAQADAVGNSNLIGIVQSKSSSVLCDIRVTGITPPIFTGLDETKEYYLSTSTAGLVVDETIATGGAGSVIIRVGQPFSSTEMFVSKGMRIIRG